MRWDRFTGFMIAGLLAVGLGPAGAELPRNAILEAADQRGGAPGAAVGGDVIYLARGQRIVVLVADGDAALRQVHASEPLGGAVTALARVDDLLIAGWRSAGKQGFMSLFSLADREAPGHLDDFAYNQNEPGFPADILAVDDWLFVADTPLLSDGLSQGLFAIDFADPDEPLVFEPLAFSGRHPRLTLLDEHHLLLSTTPESIPGGNVLVLDIAERHSPQQLGHYRLQPGGGRSATVAGDGFMAVFGFDRTEIVSLANPAEPERIAQLPAIGGEALLIDGYLISAEHETLRSWDLGDPRNPVELDPVSVPLTASHRAVRGPGPDSAVFFDATAGLAQQVDVSVPAAPVPGKALGLPYAIRGLDVATIPSGIAVTGFQGSLATYSNDLEVGERIDPDWIAGPVRAIESRSDGIALLFITTDAGAGVQSIDLTDPGPDAVSAFIAIDDLESITLHGDRAWTAAGSVIHELDLSDPLDPAIIATVESDHATVGGLAHDDGFLYASGTAESGAEADEGLWTYAVGSESAPALTGQLRISGDCPAGPLEVSGGLAALVCGRGKAAWYFFDVSDPAHPERVGEYGPAASGPSASVLFHQDLVWLGFADGVDLVDLRDPGSPALVNRFHVPGLARGLAASANGIRVASDRFSAGGQLPPFTGGGIARIEMPPPITPGQTAAWFDPGRNGEGWMIEVLDDERALGYWYTYDIDGNPRWLTGIGAIRGNRVDFDMVEYSGGRFGSASDPQQIESAPAGTVHMRFSDCDVGWFRYQADGNQTLRINLDRLTRTLGLAGCEPDARSAAAGPAGQSGSWYDPAYSGQGYAVHWLDEARALVQWFGFDSRGDPFWTFGVGESEGGKLVVPEMMSARGARFGKDFDADDVELIEWGEVEIELSCTSGWAEYHSVLPSFGSGRFELRRLTIPAGLNCD